MKIDAHHHLWYYNRKSFPWIEEDMEVLQRDYLPGDLSPVLQKQGIEGVVTVQARQLVEETEWLLKLAGEYDFIYGIVGWAPLVSPEVEKYLEKWSQNRYLKAIRHVLQDEPDDSYMLRSEFNRGIQVVTQYGLVYDILIFEHHLPQTLRFVDMHPDQIFVLDHIAKPRIRDNQLSPWREYIMKLAERENIYCKLSGLVTEADINSWTENQLFQYFNVVLEAFGPTRLMYGSDWPVCLLAAGYAEWYHTVLKFITDLSTAEQARILGQTAIEVYGLESEQ